MASLTWHRFPWLLGLASLVVLTGSGWLAGAASAAGWSRVPLPQLRAGRYVVAYGELSGVACASRRFCEAVGDAGQAAPLTERWNGARWSLQRLPHPPNTRGSALIGVSCSSPRACVAIGQYNVRGSQAYLPLAERWNGMRWRLETVAAPGARVPSIRSRLSAVACPASNSCVAVGELRQSGQAVGVPLIERWDGRRWRVQASPRVSGALWSVACSSPPACTAMGSVEISQGDQENLTFAYATVIERWDGTRWTTQAAPDAPGAASTGLNPVSCPTQLSCLAAGSALYNQTHNGVQYNGINTAVTGRWDGSRWSAQPVAIPTGQPTNSAPQTTEGWLNGISCVSATDCMAVGEYRATNGNLGPLTARWDGSTWAPTTFAVRSDFTLYFNSVSCPARSWCMAVGPALAQRYS